MTKELASRVVYTTRETPPHSLSSMGVLQVLTRLWRLHTFSGTKQTPSLEQALVLLRGIRGGVDLLPSTLLIDVDIDSIDMVEWIAALGGDDSKMMDEHIWDLLEAGTVEQMYEAIVA